MLQILYRSIALRKKYICFSLIGILSLIAAAIALPPQISMHLPPAQKELGKAWKTALPKLPPFLNVFYTTTGYSTKITLCEDGIFLPYPDSLHDDIRNIGLGHYSHWENSLYFSTTNNDNPNINGKIYKVIIQLSPRIWLYGALFSFALILLSCLFPQYFFPAFLHTSENEISSLEQNHTRRKVLIQTVSMCLALSIFFIGCGLYLNKKQGPLQLVQRVQIFKKNPSKYDIVFLGDSRTYCGIHPRYLDPLLGTHSINLSSFAHWFPTQLAQFRDLGTALQGKTVVWSIGHQNFKPGTIQNVYPLDIKSSITLASLNLFLDGFWTETFRSHIGTRIFAERAILREHIENFLRIPAHQSEVKKKPLIFESPVSQEWAENKAAQLKKILEKDTGIRSITPVYDNGLLNSLVLQHYGGGYERIEIVPEYFRWQQKQHEPQYNDAEFVEFRPDVRFLELFREMLSQFKSSGTKLIVNELEEANFMYPSKGALAGCRQFMRNVVQPMVENFGFIYVRTNLDALQRDDYFDYNHLNSKGIAKYSPMLAEAIRSFIGD